MSDDWLNIMRRLTRLAESPTVFMHPDDIREVFTEDEIRRLEESGHLQWHEGPEGRP